MKDQVLSIERMQHLKELGVDTRKASMAIVYTNKYGDVVDWELVDESIHDPDVGEHNPYLRSRYGTFTLQDILDLLPEEIEKPKGDFFLSIERINHYWYVSYISYLKNGISKLEVNCETKLIDAAYELLCWCAENGYIKTNKED